jgi:DNA primase
LKEGYSVSLLKDTGLFGNYSGGLTDLFNDRLIFPIHNSLGEVIAFGGRITEPKEGVGKYINSPELNYTPKEKSSTVYFKTNTISVKQEQLSLARAILISCVFMKTGL